MQSHLRDIGRNRNVGEEGGRAARLVSQHDEAHYEAIEAEEDVARREAEHGHGDANEKGIDPWGSPAHDQDEHA